MEAEQGPYTTNPAMLHIAHAPLCSRHSVKQVLLRFQLQKRERRATAGAAPHTNPAHRPGLVAGAEDSGPLRTACEHGRSCQQVTAAHIPAQRQKGMRIRNGLAGQLHGSLKTTWTAALSIEEKKHPEKGDGQEAMSGTPGVT